MLEESIEEESETNKQTELWKHLKRLRRQGFVGKFVEKV